MVYCALSGEAGERQGGRREKDVRCYLEQEFHSFIVVCDRSERLDDLRWGTMNAWSRMVESGAIRTWIGVIELIIAMRFVRFVHTYSLARRINLFLQRTRNVSISSRGWTRWDSQNSPNSFFDALNL